MVSELHVSYGISHRTPVTFLLGQKQCIPRMEGIKKSKALEIPKSEYGLSPFRHSPLFSHISGLGPSHESAMTAVIHGTMEIEDRREECFISMYFYPIKL